MEMMRNAYSVLVGKPEARHPVERPRSRYEYNIIMDFREIGWEDVDWTSGRLLLTR
jgi:hypothetical protein